MKMQIIETSCSRRHLELERVKHYFARNGYEISLDNFEVDKEADVILVSTCAFTQAAEDFSVKTFERVIREKKPSCKVMLGGCLPKINPNRISGIPTFNPQDYEAIEKYMGFTNKLSEIRTPNIVADWSIPTAYREHGLMESNDSELDVSGKETKLENYETIRYISKTVGDRVFRIQCLQGCACKCTYCAIKFAIGKVHSKPIADILEEVREGIQLGYEKICLDSDSLGCYGVDIGCNLGDLLTAVTPLIANSDAILDLPDISPAYLECCYEQIMHLIEIGKLHVFYIPIQSGSQKVIDAMKRGYDIKKTAELISNISKIESVTVGTSIIVGFPGETEADLWETIEMCKQLNLKFIYCHSFSARKGTPAYNLPDQVPEEEILRRARLFKSEVKPYCKYLTIAEDTKGNRTCQG